VCNLPSKIERVQFKLALSFQYARPIRVSPYDYFGTSPSYNSNEGYSGSIIKFFNTTGTLRELPLEFHYWLVPESKFSVIHFTKNLIVTGGVVGRMEMMRQVGQSGRIIVCLRRILIRQRHAMRSEWPRSRIGFHATNLHLLNAFHPFNFSFPAVLSQHPTPASS
jgi:hypothetical protein